MNNGHLFFLLPRKVSLTGSVISANKKEDDSSISSLSCFEFDRLDLSDDEDDGDNNSETCLHQNLNAVSSMGGSGIC